MVFDALIRTKYGLKKFPITLIYFVPALITKMKVGSYNEKGQVMAETDKKVHIRCAMKQHATLCSSMWPVDWAVSEDLEDITCLACVCVLEKLSLLNVENFGNYPQ